MNEFQLIFSFYRHPVFGLSLEGYLVKLMEDQTLSYEYQRIVFERLGDYNYPFSEDEITILMKIKELSQKSIESHFNKKPLKSLVFMEKLSQDKEMLKALSGYFDRRISVCLDLLIGKKAYWKERTSDHPGMVSFDVLKIPAVLVYHFEKNEEGIRYHLEMSQDGKPVKLHEKNSEILCHTPAWILHTKNIYHFSDGTDGNKISPFLKKPELLIPDRLADQYLESFMVKASRKFDVRYTGFNVVTEPQSVKTVLSIENALDMTPVISQSFHYDTFRITAAQDQEVLVKLQRETDGHTLFRFPRDRDYEQKQIALLESFGLKREQPSWYLPKDSEKYPARIDTLLEWISENRESLINAGFGLETEWQGSTYVNLTAKVETKQVKEAQDWFDIFAVVIIGELEIPFVKFRRHILSRDREYKLPDGRIFLLPEAWFIRYADVFEFGEAEEFELRLHKQHEGLLKGHPLLDGELNSRLKDAQKSIYTEKANLDYPLPAGLNATLRDYQKKGFEWLSYLADKRMGACLADDMGLGKTLQVIAVLQSVKERKLLTPGAASGIPISTRRQLDLFAEVETKAPESLPSLIVMAPSLIHNWDNELKKFAPGLSVLKFVGQRRNPDPAAFYQSDIILTTYGVIRNDVEILSRLNFGYIILDESQLIKNVRSVSFQSVKLLQGKHKIVLTGTPVENSLADLWSQLTFLQPGLLGSFKYFKQEFVIPVEQQKDVLKLERLRKIISPFILRRTKEEVVPELPPLTKSVHYCEMHTEQREFYEEQKSLYRNHILDNISKEGIEKSQLLILRGLTQLRKIAIHPVLNNPDYKGSSAKFDQVLSRLTAISEEGRKVLVFSQFVTHLNLFREHFKREETAYSYLTGEVPQTHRAGVISEFENHKGHRVFLIQLKTGGSGLNLTQADSVFLLDPWWNPATEDQAIARSHRLGQHNPVFAWRFITKDTIEEKILRLQERKSRLASDIIGLSNPFGRITQSELEELFE